MKIMGHNSQPLGFKHPWAFDASSQPAGHLLQSSSDASHLTALSRRNYNCMRYMADLLRQHDNWWCLFLLTATGSLPFLAGKELNLLFRQLWVPIKEQNPQVQIRRRQESTKGCLTNAEEFARQLFEQMTGLSPLQTHPNSRIALTHRIATLQW